MSVSKNNGAQTSNLNRVSIINHPFGGAPIYGDESVACFNFDFNMTSDARISPLKDEGGREL